MPGLLGHSRNDRLFPAVVAFGVLMVNYHCKTLPLGHKDYQSADACGFKRLNQLFQMPVILTNHGVSFSGPVLTQSVSESWARALALHVLGPPDDA